MLNNYIELYDEIEKRAFIGKAVKLGIKGVGKVLDVATKGLYKGVEKGIEYGSKIGEKTVGHAVKPVGWLGRKIIPSGEIGKTVIKDVIYPVAKTAAKHPVTTIFGGPAILKETFKSYQPVKDSAINFYQNSKGIR